VTEKSDFNVLLRHGLTCQLNLDVLYTYTDFDEDFIETLARARETGVEGKIAREHPLWILHHHFLPLVVGKVAYERAKTTKTISTFVTVSDEAFAILCIDNVYEKKMYGLWGQEGVKCPWKGGDQPPAITESKYTSKKQGEGTSYSTKFSGWSADAFTQYEHFYRTIAAARDTKEGRTIESLILQTEQERMPLKKKLRKAKNIEKEGKQQSNWMENLLLWLNY
jgi:hypothetical protein